jgi:flagellar biogenesis protein FliO
MNSNPAFVGHLLPGRLRGPGFWLLAAGFLGTGRVWGEAALAPGALVQPGGLPDAGSSVLRLFGALVLVIGIFLAGVWLFRNWQRFAVRKGGAPRLNVIEVKSLGQRQAIYVVGYEQQRILLASSPAGITLLTHLPEAEAQPLPEPARQPSFAEAFRQVLTRKS